MSNDLGQELQEDVNTIVGSNENFNNAVVQEALDLKNDGVFQNPNPLTVAFRDIKKFDAQNPIIGKLATEIKASKVTEEQLTNNILIKDEIAKIENRLDELRRFNNRNNRKGSGGNGGNAGFLPDQDDDDEYEALMKKLENLHRRPVPPPRPRPENPFENLDDPFDAYVEPLRQELQDPEAYQDPLDTLEEKFYNLRHNTCDPEVTTDDTPPPPPPYISPEVLPNIPQTQF